MWTLYDRLIDLMPEDDALADCAFGESWTTAVTRTGKAGVAARCESRPGGSPEAARFVGLRLREAAALVKSWDFGLAALGLAAINAHLNVSARFADDERTPDAFLRYADRARGKKVAVIGRFAYLESRLAGLCDLSVIERRPGPGDYPDPACEYLLPEADVVFITGSATVNKTMPRLLELSKNAFTVVCGPSTSMSGAFFELGADALCGFCVTDAELCRRAAADRSGIFKCGRMVCLEKARDLSRDMA